MLYTATRYNMSMVKTTIQLEESTRNILRDLGKKSETYDEIILKLVNAATEKKMKMVQEIRN